MAFSNFQDLCDCICELAGVKAPQLEPNSDGCLAFTIAYTGVDIGFIEEHRGEPAAMLVANFGAPPGWDEMNALARILQTDFLHSPLGAPLLVQDPEGREVALHQPWPLSNSRAHDIHEAMTRIAGAAAWIR